ncbi:MAG: helix-turn-helix domain-containing protein [Proteobacteria bacterium]|nr:helix-turn-helix domain-containing protein [Pseudomonadota bacterium]
MKLENWLTDNDISASKFAQSINVDHSTVSRYLSGTRRPKPEILRRISAVTMEKVTPNDFLA